MNLTTSISDKAKQIMMNLPVPALQMLIKLKPPTTLVPMDILPNKYGLALETLIKQREGRELGDYLEFGVSRGSSLSCMYRAAKSLKLENMRFFGFDSFQGLPDEVDSDDEHTWYAGQFYSSLKFTTAFLMNQGVGIEDVNLIKGWFDDTCNPATLKQYQIAKAGIINIDCDIYSSTKIALDFCEPLIQDDVIVFFDDWHTCNLAEKGLGERKAFEEFLADNPRFSARELPDLKYNEASTAFYLKVSA